MASNLDAIRNAVAQGKALAAEFHTAHAKFFQDGNATPVFECDARARKPRPSAFDAGNQTEWATKRVVVLKVPMDANGSELIQKGLIVQLSPVDEDNVDGDPTLYGINFTVQSSLGSQFSAEREVILVTEVRGTPRIDP